MVNLPVMVPASDLRQEAAATLKRLAKGHAPIIITQKGRAAAVLMSVKEYEHAEEERAILLRLARGEQEIQAGEGTGLDELFAEADLLLNTRENPVHLLHTK